MYAGRVRVAALSADVKGDFEAIVAGDLFDRVHILDGRKVHKPHHKSNPEFPLRRFIRCGACETPLTGSRSRGRNRSYPYYHCHRCGKVRVRKQELESSFVVLLERLQPSEEYLRLFRAVVLDAWTERTAEARNMRQETQKRVDAMRERSDQLDDAFIFQRAIDKATYERQRDRLREDLALAELELQQAKLEEIDVEGILGFAERTVTNAARLWVEASHEQKQRLQAAFFPEGLPFDGERFGTAPICLAFKQIEPSEESDSGVASRVTPRGRTGP